MNNLAKWRNRPCPTCKARVGQHCVSDGGKEALTWVHTARKGQQKPSLQPVDVGPVIRTIPFVPAKPGIAAQLTDLAFMIMTSNKDVQEIVVRKDEFQVNAARTAELNVLNFQVRTSKAA